MQGIWCGRQGQAQAIGASHSQGNHILPWRCWRNRKVVKCDETRVQPESDRVASGQSLLTSFNREGLPRRDEDKIAESSFQGSTQNTRNCHADLLRWSRRM